MMSAREIPGGGAQLSLLQVTRHCTCKSLRDKVEMTRHSAMETVVVAIAKDRLARVAIGKGNAVGLHSDAG